MHLLEWLKDIYSIISKNELLFFHSGDTEKSVPWAEALWDEEGGIRL